MVRQVLNPVDGPWAGPGAPGVEIYGIKLASIPPHDANTQLTMVSQTLYLCKVIPMIRSIITTMATRVATAGATPTAGYNGFAIYADGASLTPLGSTADDTALWTSTGWRAKTLTTPVTLQPGVAYWLGMEARCGTAPTVLQTAPANAALLAGMPGGKTVGSLAAQSGVGTTLTKSALTDLASRPFLTAY